jgi:hypothetical protein
MCCLDFCCLDVYVALCRLLILNLYQILRKMKRCHRVYYGGLLTFVLYSLATKDVLVVEGFLSPIQGTMQRSCMLLSLSLKTEIPALDHNRSAPEGAEILSHDPLVYRIPNLLSKSECEDFISRTKELELVRDMKLSNPPEVSLNIQKLWSLPFLSLGAGIPPLIRYNAQTGNVLPPMDQLGSVVLPFIATAFLGSVLLAYGVVLPIVKKISNSKARTSLAMALNEEEDIPFLRNLVGRVSKATQHPWQSFEAPVFTRYTPGAIFAKHSDASPTRGREWEKEGGQRVITCICYLNTLQSGGETSFDKLGFSVGPIQGSALIFFPTIPGYSLDADDRMTHESISSNEEKCIIQMFGRVGSRVLPPLGLPNSFE